MKRSEGQETRAKREGGGRTPGSTALRELRPGVLEPGAEELRGASPAQETDESPPGAALRGEGAPRDPLLPADGPLPVWGSPEAPGSRPLAFPEQLGRKL